MVEEIKLFGVTIRSDLRWSSNTDLKVGLYDKISSLRREIKKNRKIWIYVQIICRKAISEPYFFQKIVWTKNFEVGRSAMDVHTFINL